MEDYAVTKAVRIAKKIARDVLVKRQILDEQGKYDEPLFVFTSERHGSGWQHAIQILALEYLKAHEDQIALGMEYPHNLLSSYFMDIVPEETLSNPNFSKEFKDPQNVFQLKTLLFSRQPFIAVKAYHALLHGIPSKLNDAASKFVTKCGKIDDILDNSDILTGTFSKAAGIDLQGHHLCLSPEGMYVRNLSMARLVLEHASDTNARIYVQNIGAWHLAGHRNPNYPNYVLPYEQSIMGLFDKQNITNYLGVIFNHPDFNILESIADIDMARVISFDVRSLEGMSCGDIDDNEENMAIIKRALAGRTAYKVYEGLPTAIEEARKEILGLSLLRIKELAAGLPVTNLPQPRPVI